VSHRPVPAPSGYRDLASGFVPRSAPGSPALPVRLAQVLFLRCAAHLPVTLRRQRPGYLAAEVARRFASALQDVGGDLSTVAATADVFVPAGLAALPTADLVVTDLPYGEQTTWQGVAPPAGEALSVMLRSLCRVLPNHAVLALCARTQQISFDSLVPSLDRLRLGHPAPFLGRVGDMRGAW
jgi:hypothetical protein